MMTTASPERIEHALQVLSSLENMKSREFICDFEVKVENQTFNTHRALLAACSGYFEALFSSNMKEVQDGYIAMKDVEASPIEQCIRYMYTGSCKIEMDSVEGLLHASNLLQIQSLERKCFNFLKNNLRPDNCLSILTLAKTFSHKDVEKAAEDLAVKNLETVISSDLFLKISKKDLLRYISHANQETSWLAVKTWSKGREKEFEELAEQIDFSKFPFKILLNEVLDDPLVDKSPKIKLIVQQSLFSDSEKLERNLDSRNCFHLKKFATDEKSRKIIDSFMCKNFSIIVSDPQFCDLCNNEVICLLKSQEIYSEESKWEASLKWVKQDPGDRRTSFPDLFSTLNLLNLPLEFLKDTVRNEELVKNSISCMNRLVDAIINYAEKYKQMKEEKSTEDPKVAVDASTMCYKQQPRGGKMTDELQTIVDIRRSTPLISFTFIWGSFEGVNYPACSFEFRIPNQNHNLRNRLSKEFKKRQLFRLKHKSGSDRGEIVLGDIPLDPDFNPSDEAACLTYGEKLHCELEKIGF